MSGRGFSLPAARALRLIAVAIALIIFTAGAQQGAADEAQSGSAGEIIRTSVDLPNPMTGQHVRLIVEVLFPDRMPAPPQVEAPQSQGLQIFRFESQGQTLRDTIDGRTYVGQRFEFAVYPRRAGELVIPPVEIRLMSRSGDVTGKAAGEAKTLNVIAPPGLDPAKPSIASTSVTLEEAWEPADAAGPLHSGDALTRTVKRQAADTPALAFAPLAGRIEGVRVYTDAPDADDRVERGRLTGLRTDRITYVFEKPGAYALPQVFQPWWDLTAGKLRNAVGEGRSVTVAATAVAADGTDGRIAKLGWRRTAGLVVAALFATGLAGLGVARFVKASRSGPSTSALFRGLKGAAASGDPCATYRALSAWSTAEGVDPERLVTIASVQVLERALFSVQASWNSGDGRTLIADLQRLRLANRDAQVRVTALPPLNPAQGGNPIMT